MFLRERERAPRLGRQGFARAFDQLRLVPQGRQLFDRVHGRLGVAAVSGMGAVSAGFGAACWLTTRTGGGASGAGGGDVGRVSATASTTPDAATVDPAPHPRAPSD